MAGGDLVLLTGATGLVGFAVLRAALKKGYKIRAAVRSEAKAETVRSNPTLKDISKDQLSFVIVPDILPDGAFDEAAKGVKYILHVASPVPAPHITGEDDLHAVLVEPAIQGTMGIFKSARKAGTVQRIVITSSAAALISMQAMMGQASEDHAFGPDDRVDPLPPPYLNNPQAAYNASKVLALKHAEEYVANEKPEFDAIHIHPSVVLGRDELALTAKDLDKGSNHFALAPVLGENAPTPFPVAICHIDDVAEAHVRALDPKVEGNQSFLLCCTGDEGYEVRIDRFPDCSLCKTLSTNTRLCHSSGKTSKCTRPNTSRKQSRKACFPTVGQWQDLLSKPILAELRKFSGSSSSRTKTWLWRWLGSMLSCWRKRVRLRRSRLSLELMLASSTLVDADRNDAAT